MASLQFLVYIKKLLYKNCLYTNYSQYNCKGILLPVRVNSISFEQVSGKIGSAEITSEWNGLVPIMSVKNVYWTVDELVGK